MHQAINYLWQLLDTAIYCVGVWVACNALLGRLIRYCVIRVVDWRWNHFCLTASDEQKAKHLGVPLDYMHSCRRIIELREGLTGFHLVRFSRLFWRAAGLPIPPDAARP